MGPDQQVVGVGVPGLVMKASKVSISTRRSEDILAPSYAHTLISRKVPGDAIRRT